MTRLPSIGSIGHLHIWEYWVSTQQFHGNDLIRRHLDEPKQLWQISCCHGDIFSISIPAIGPFFTTVNPPPPPPPSLLHTHIHSPHVLPGDKRFAAALLANKRLSWERLHASINIWWRRHEIVICWFHTAQLNAAWLSLQAVSHPHSSLPLVCIICTWGPICACTHSHCGGISVVDLGKHLSVKQQHPMQTVFISCTLCLKRSLSVCWISEAFFCIFAVWKLLLYSAF